jgi:hypothetical protein
MALVASGPMITCREVPNRAYITIAATATYKPATGLTPARSPYAIDDGTRTAKTVTATMKSVRSSRGVTPLKRARPGMNLAMPFEGEVDVLIGHLLIIM